ncbi:hypothetical protein ACH4TX_44540 [Streptomyces sp. NPDC021098]|uniref:hypothetical protein n=1 Tax=unclassified Streptomyces TaxID=2593676 RepID=UPI00379C460E
MTLQEQQEAATTYAKYESLALCDYKTVLTEGASPTPLTREIDLDPTVARVFGLGRTQELVRTAAKTWSFQGELYTANQEPVATLYNATITALKLNDPATGAPLISVVLDFLATSHGWRTGRGYAGEPYGMPNQLFFKNSVGGVVWVMDLRNFLLQCGWNRWHDTYGGGDRYNVAWFDVCEGVTHEVRGAVYRC